MNDLNCRTVFALATAVCLGYTAYRVADDHVLSTGAKVACMGVSLLTYAYWVNHTVFSVSNTDSQ